MTIFYSLPLYIKVVIFIEHIQKKLFDRTF